MDRIGLRSAGTSLRMIGLTGLLLCGTTLYGEQQAAKPPAQEAPNPILNERPAPKPKSLLIPEGKIQLNVVVSDAAGKPVTGLEPWDFKILDNGQPRKVMSYRAYDGVTVMPSPPVEMFLVLDTANLPFEQVSVVRAQVKAFLRQNGGALKLPTTLILLTDAGIRLQPRPSTDGNAIATVVDGIKGGVRTIDSAMGWEGLLERFQLSERAIDGIAQNEARKPGRKLLVWVGPGWPILNRPPDVYTDTQERSVFDSIVELSGALREAQITVYSVAPGWLTNYTLLYKSYLKGVRTFREADFGNLALKVLATQTGGEIFGPDNDLVEQMNRCVADANAYYRISFDPPHAAHADEYHDLKVGVDKPGVVVRTTTGYYDQPPAN